MTRFGMDVTAGTSGRMKSSLEVEAVAAENAKNPAVLSQRIVNMAAFKDADIVYQELGAVCFMEKRTELYDGTTLRESMLWKRTLEQNAHSTKDWACTEELMKTTKDDNALYLHICQDICREYRCQ